MIDNLSLRSYRRLAAGATSLALLLAGAVIAAGQQDGGVSGVIVTFERVFESNEGQTVSLGTGTLYLTPKHVSLWRRDVRRPFPPSGETFESTEIRTELERVTISHDLKNAIRGPRNAYWEPQAPIPSIVSYLPAPTADRGHSHAEAPHSHGDNGGEMKLSSGLRTYGPMVLRAWTTSHQDGSLTVIWVDDESDEVVVREMHLPDGSMAGERLRSAKRASLPADTFGIPAGYTVRELPTPETER